MQFLARTVLPLVVMAFLAGPLAAGGDKEPVQQMAKILADLNHFPSDADRKKLEAIAADDEASEYERVIAEAIMNVEHQVSDEDRPRLESVLHDEAAGDEVRTLAEVVLNLDHAPSDAEKEQLESIAAR